MKRKIHLLSVVVPVYNEAEGINQFHSLLTKEIKKIDIPDYEIIFVNDGSKDETSDKLVHLAEADEKVKVIELTRNFGKEPALSAGLHNVSGDCIVTLDADGQHPPAKIADLINYYEQGYDMVVGVRTVNPDEKALKKLGNKFYYRLIHLTGAQYIQPRVTDFRAMSREVVNTFGRLSERRRITRGLLDWMGFSTHYVDFESAERMAGEASYSTKKLFLLAVDSILANSRRPLLLSGLIGLTITSISMLGLIFALVEGYVFNDPYNLHITGTAVIALFIVFMVGLIFLSQGILALYLSRIYEESQQRPLYIIHESKSKLNSKQVNK